MADDNPDKNFKKLTESEIFDEFKFFFIVGTDTTSHFTEAMLMFIGQNPRVEKCVRE